MGKKRDISLLLARRQKRLVYWKEQFSGGKLEEQNRDHLNELFSKYTRAIAKIVSGTEQEAEACEIELEAIERELTSTFEQLRLMTSPFGIPAISE